MSTRVLSLLTTPLSLRSLMLRLSTGRLLVDVVRSHCEESGLGCTLAPSTRTLASCNAKHYNCSARLEALVDDQITVRLPTPLGRTLRRASRRLGRRPSDVVR